MHEKYLILGAKCIFRTSVIRFYKCITWIIQSKGKEICKTSDLFFQCDFLSDPAEGLWGDAQVGGNKILGDALYELREHLGKLQVPVFGGFAVGLGDAVVEGGQGVLDQDAE